MITGRGAAPAPPRTGFFTIATDFSTDPGAARTYNGGMTQGMPMASDPLAAQRDRVIVELSTGFAGDRFEVDELERRLALAHAAQTAAALDALVTDLAPVRTAALVPARELRVVMGSIERAGAWAVPAHLRARVLCGHLRLDLRDAQLAPGVTALELRVTMGSVEVIVGPDTAVALDAGSWLGRVEDHTTPRAGAARIVQITGRVAMGSLEAWTLLPGERSRDARRRRRWERRARRRLARHARRCLPWPLDL